MLDWLESTETAHYVQQSIWGYPIILSAHAIGMGVLAGIVLMINFRILGFAPSIPIASLKSLHKVALVGLGINAVSGTMLFMAKANSFFDSTPFRVKIILLVIGIVLLAMLPRRIARAGDSVQGSESVRSLKVVGAVSTAIWIGVIISGRLIAYLDTSYF